MATPREEWARSQATQLLLADGLELGATLQTIGFRTAEGLTGQDRDDYLLVRRTYHRARLADATLTRPDVASATAAAARLEATLTLRP